MEHPMSGAAIEKVSISELVRMNVAEIDLLVATAKRYPRDIELFTKTTPAMVTFSEEFAGKCVYAFTRGGKIIVGPSVRFAECVQHNWGNTQTGGRIAEVNEKTVVSQGVFIDLQTNTRITREVSTKIVNKEGERFSEDMITVTGNASISKAIRNAILQGIPKPYWGVSYDAVIGCIGDPRDIPTRTRPMAIAFFEKLGVKPEQLCKVLHVEAVDKIWVDQIVALRGFRTAIEEGELTIDQIIRQAKPIPHMPKATTPKATTPKASTRSAPAAGAASKGAAGASTRKPKGKVTITHQGKVDVVEQELIPPDKPKAGPITKNQYMDLLIWLGEHGLQAVDARQAAIKLGYNGPTKDLPAALLPKIYEAFADRK